MQVRRRTLVVLALALFVAGAAFKCSQSQITTAAATVDKVAILNKGFQASAQAAKQSGLVSAQEDIQLQQWVVKIADINDKLAQAILDGQAGNANWRTEVDAALALAKDLNQNSLLFIKNPTKQAELTAIVVGIRSTLDIIAQEVGQ